jgi:hypothetical protein
MSLPILPTNISIPQITLPTTAPVTPSGGSGGAFSSMFNDAVQKVETFQQNAQTSANKFVGRGRGAASRGDHGAAGRAFLSDVHAGEEQDCRGVSTSDADAGVSQ